jgi:hypothetical protein
VTSDLVQLLQHTDLQTGASHAKHCSPRTYVRSPLLSIFDSKHINNHVISLTVIAQPLPKPVLKRCDLVLPLSNLQYLFFSFMLIQELLISSSSSSLHIDPSLYISFNKVLQKAVPTQGMTNPVSFPLDVITSLASVC